MATATTKSKCQKRGVPNLSKLFIDTPPLQLSCNTTNQQRKPDDEDNDSKLKTSHKSQKALQLAQLINRNPWSEDLQSSLSSLFPSLSKTTVLQTLHRIKTPSKSLQFFNWVSSLSNPNGLPHDNQIYLTMLEILGRARRLNAARNLLFSIPKRSGSSVQLDDRLFNSLIRSYGRAGLFNESVKVFTTMKSMGVSPSVFTFNNLLSILLCRGRTGMAQQLFDEMLKTYGVMPDVFTFNILIRGFCMSSMTDEGFRFFNEMSRFQCDPDVVTYNTLVDGLCRAGKVKNARNLVKGMCTKREELSPNAVTYTTLIRGYCVQKDIAEALDVFEEMLDRGLNPNKITYNTLIQGLCEAKRFDKIKELFKGARGCGEFAPDTCTFNTLMSAHCNAGKLEESIVVFKKMADFQVHPDSASYSILIRGLCAKGLFEKAEELFDELAEKEILLRDEGCEPLVAAYNPMFEHLCANGKTKKAEKIFRQLMKRGTHDPPSYKTLIMGHCMERTFLDGYNLLLLMLRRDFVPDFETYQSLIEGLLQKGYPVLAHRTLEMMLKSSHLPKGSTFHSILSELVKKLNARESSNFITLMVERKIRQNINLSTGAVILLFKSGLREKALKVLSLLYENGYSVQMDELVSFLCCRRKLLDARTVLLFSLEKHGKVDTCMCDTVITGLCKMGENSEAFGLFYELVEKGIQLQLDSLENLKLSLESDGKSKEAEFVSKRMSKRSL
ncbi:hypothetical protein Nepgr_012551 [Nepenthes gracilis]|uniref:Pentatricopeptide repeat-containing protein n=1 Tax=Nepenthes gracilis TaxID=150966 RepID=A0AAD3XNG0_NEPGR|nr:hypothetical protein Nepgr_012551 [Nepenthes gracilis]